MGETRDRSWIAAAGLLVALAVTGCGSGARAPMTRIVLIEGEQPRLVSAAIARGARAQARRSHVSLQVDGPRRLSPGAQILAVDAAIAVKPAAVLIVPAAAHALVAPIASMDKAGIRVVRIATTVGHGRAPTAARAYRDGADAVRAAQAD